MKLEGDFDNDEIEELLREAAESGEPVVLTDSEWDAMLREARAAREFATPGFLG